VPRFGPSSLRPDCPPLPTQPHDTDWPTTAWPVGTPAGGVDRDAAASLHARFFDPHAEKKLGITHALLVVHRGRLVQERYGPTHDEDSTLPSWSMAKSMLQTLIGMLVGEGKLRIDEPAPVPEWQAVGDPRRSITLDQLLRMSSGLEFYEVYDDSGFSDTIEMLFKSGKPDVAGYAASKPLAAAPGSVWNYSSGTTNILSRIVHDALGLRGDDFVAHLRSVLLDRIGMKSVKPLLDERGTWIASSFAFSTARDFARFGLFCLRDGTWQGERILPEGWIDYARTPTAHSQGQYGAHFWLAQDGSGTFSANGFRSQYIVMVPERDLVIVRLGDSETDQKVDLLPALADLVRAYPLLS
jgi:CubicO group peptidase (beta-lactamase class C family)